MTRCPECRMPLPPYLEECPFCRTRVTDRRCGVEGPIVVGLVVVAALIILLLLFGDLN